MTNRYSKRLRREPPEYGIFSKQCLICLDTKHTDFYKKNPNCTHNICIICLDKWLKINDKCPLCKKDLIYSNIFFDNGMYAPINNIFNPLIQVINLFAFSFNFIHHFLWRNDNNIFYNAYIERDNEDIYNSVLQELHSTDIFI